ncbi:MAG: hypothetical protein Q9201_004679 [Fulgogasparrea decipioides]
MARESRLTRLSKLDEHDPSSERDTDAQRREFQEQLDKLDKGATGSHERSNATRFSATKAMRHKPVRSGSHSENHHTRQDPGNQPPASFTETSESDAARKVQVPPRWRQTKPLKGMGGDVLACPSQTASQTQEIGKTSVDLDLSSDRTVSDIPSEPADEPPEVDTHPSIRSPRSSSGSSSRWATRVTHGSTDKPTTPASQSQHNHAEKEVTELRGRTVPRKRAIGPVGTRFEDSKTREVNKNQREQPEASTEPSTPIHSTHASDLVRNSGSPELRGVPASRRSKVVPRILSAIWERCRARLDQVIWAARPLQSPPGRVFLPGLAITVTFLALVVMIGFCFVIGTNITALAITAADRMMSTTCQWPDMSWLCAYCCGSSSFLSMHVFSATCSSFPVNRHPTMDPSPYWEAENDLDGIDNIPRLLSKHQGSSTLYEAKVRRLRGSFSIAQEKQEELLQAQVMVSGYLGNISQDLPQYYRHAYVFSKSLLHSLHATQTQIENVMHDSSRDAAVDQQVINDRVPSILAAWQKRYEALEKPGSYMAHEVDTATRHVAQLLDDMQHAKEQTVRGRKAEVKTWPLARRVGYAIRLLRKAPEELYEFDDALKGLAEWETETRATLELLTMIRANVSQLDSDLGNLAAKRPSADVRFRLGPDGLLDVHAYITGLHSQTRGIQTTIGGAQVIKRKEETEDSSRSFAGEDTHGTGLDD